MKGKKNSLIEILHDNKPQIFLLTETQLRSNAGMQIEGYKFFSRKREGKTGGGVGILVKDDIVDKVIPHISDRPIEIMWLSIRRKKTIPLFVAVYYGQQESRTSKEEIENEMNLLQEEIREMSNEGDILIAMDGNGRIGLLDEEISRNGRLLLRVFQEENLNLMNGSDKCQGKITRKNTKKDNEISAIDFVVASHEVKNMITKMVIDEDGMYKVKGRNETDHNTICIDMEMNDMEKTKSLKKLDWNLRASSEKWAEFGEELVTRKTKAQEIIEDKNIPFEERYKKWYKELENAARNTIGKTTFKAGGKEKFSHETKQLQKEKKKLKNQIRSEKDNTKRNQLLEVYRNIKETVTSQITQERHEINKEKFEKIIADRSKRTFWKEKKKLSRDPVLENITIKDKNGLRQYNPDSVMENTALYYESLYQSKLFEPQQYHTKVKENMQQHLVDTTYENQHYNLTPDIDEVTEAIQNKSNGKSTTDVKNEMLKRPGEKMSHFIYPLIKAIWEEEEIPSKWNLGQITSIWKGKGDRECLSNHRGITISSAIGSIVESLIDNRIEAHVPFTQAQGGGKRGSSTCDHLFILRTMIDISKADKRETYITFYDVQKAYDNADNDDMLEKIWESGLRGKAWRILKNMNSNLKATVKTRHGLTREFIMEIGGRQGSKNTGRLFAKMMDHLAEILLSRAIGFPMTILIKVPVLLWVDDVITCVVGKTEQKAILQHIDQFGKDHKLKWGQQKCQVMRVGKHVRNDSETWSIGNMQIQETVSYRYLGDVVTSDGKNTKNIDARKNKIMASTISIKTIAANETLNMMETSVILNLHDAVNLSALLTNSEAWNLNKGECEKIEQIEIQAIKLLFDLPSHIPTPALIHQFGLLYTKQRIEQKQLIYLWKLMNKEENHWTRNALLELIMRDIGWGKNIKTILSKYNLPSNLEEIKRLGRIVWTNRVKNVIENENIKRLLQDCHKTVNGEEIIKTKTAFVVKKVKETNYQRTPAAELTKCNKKETKAIMIARFGMLECGKNFQGTRDLNCSQCNTVDDEAHRLNYCLKYDNMNFRNCDTKVDFASFYSDDVNILKDLVRKISRVWNVKNANGTMITE